MSPEKGQTYLNKDVTEWLIIWYSQIFEWCMPGYQYNNCIFCILGQVVLWQNWLHRTYWSRDGILKNWQVTFWFLTHQDWFFKRAWAAWDNWKLCFVQIIILRHSEIEIKWNNISFIYFLEIFAYSIIFTKYLNIF